MTIKRYTLIESSQEVEKWVGSVIRSYVFSDKRKFIKVLNSLKKKNECGIEVASIFFYNDFEEWDQDRCQPDEIALILEMPGELGIGYMKILSLYDLLFKESQKYIGKFPETRNEVECLLKEIKAAFEFNN